MLTPSRSTKTDRLRKPSASRSKRNSSVVGLRHWRFQAEYASLCLHTGLCHWREATIAHPERRNAMASAIRDKALVVIQLSGGNDCLDTIVPYTNGLYYDFRPTVKIAPEDVLPIDNAFGFHPSMGSIKRLWDEGKVAVINGIGYPHPDRSHFRSMDIWHTAEPEKIGTEGWLGRAIRALD